MGERIECLEVLGTLAHYFEDYKKNCYLISCIKVESVGLWAYLW